MSCGSTLKKLSIFIVIVGCMALLIAHFIELGALEKPLEQAEKAAQEHEEEHEKYGIHRTDCDGCEEIEETMSALNKAVALIWTATVKSLTFLGIGCGVLYGIGEIAENTALTRKYALDIYKNTDAANQNAAASASNYYKFNSEHQ